MYLHKGINYNVKISLVNERPPLKISFSYVFLTQQAVKNVEILVSMSKKEPNYTLNSGVYANPKEISIYGEGKDPVTNREMFTKKWLYMTIISHTQDVKLKLFPNFQNTVSKKRKGNQTGITMKEQVASIDPVTGAEISKVQETDQEINIQNYNFTRGGQQV